MFKQAALTGLYGAVFISLFIFDYVLGNGFLDMLQKLLCKIACFVKKSILEQAELAKDQDTQIPINFPTLLIELLVLLLTRAVLQKYKFPQGKDRFDELLNESKEALRLTDEFLEKWRSRRVPNYPSYLDEEPQAIKPLKLEVPILHMAIVDARGSTRKQQERGDAGDAINYSDSAILSVVSLVEEDSESDIVLRELTEEHPVENFKVDTEIYNRYLWDVEEEDPNVEY